MLKWIFFGLTFHLFFFSFSQKKITLTGFCYEAGTTKGASFTEIYVHYEIDTEPDNFTAIGDGSFEISIRPNATSFHLVLSNNEYITKTIYDKEIKSTENLIFHLRKRSKSFERKDIDSSIIGVSNKKLLERFKLEESDIQRIYHPIGKTSRFKFELGDGTSVTIMHESILFNKNKLRDWEKLKIIGFELQDSEDPEITIRYNNEKENKEAQQAKLKLVKRIELIELKPYCYEDVVKSDSINSNVKKLRCFAESIIERDSKNDSTYLNWSLVGKREQLNQKDFELLFQAIFEVDFEHYITVCYEPRHGILFYSENDELIGYVEICFYCSRLEDINFNLDFGTPPKETLDYLKRIFTKAGFTIKEWD